MQRSHTSGSCGVGFVCTIGGEKSHQIVQWGVEAVTNLTHRGAVGADGKSGDGAGVLTQIPEKLFLKKVEKTEHLFPTSGNLAVGVFFFYGDIEQKVEEVLKRSGATVLGWRDVPTNDRALGESALLTKPRIRHILLDTEGIKQDKKEITLFLARRIIEKHYGSQVYVPSLSSRTIVYKGLLIAPNLGEFYPDLNDPDFESSFCVFHQRFSTNTLPDWKIAQPFRVLAHNGEINTIQGNRNWMHAMEHEVWNALFGDDRTLMMPLIDPEESDSASLDRIVEMLIVSGYSPVHAVNLCVPPAWENAKLGDDIRAFYEYESLLMKPWDGPAALVFTDGKTVCAHLDRNGLRPLRYVITEDGIVVLGSEMGMIDLDGRIPREKGRLGPGDTIAVDTNKGTVQFTDEIMKEVSSGKNYREWLDRFLIRIAKSEESVPPGDPSILRKQVAFGYTSEEMKNSLRTMAETGEEMTYSMGDDTPIPPLCDKPQLLFRYFKQRFSQVTNPPVDYIRERMVMSLRMNLGHKRNFLEETPNHARRLHLDSPILTCREIEEIETRKSFKVKRISMTFQRAGKKTLLSAAVNGLGKEVVNSVNGGAEILILSDRDISQDRIAIPSLLAVSAVFSTLLREKLSNRASVIVETGEARDIHHMACLIGYGASAVYPWLAFRTIHSLSENDGLPVPFEKASFNYRGALEHGLLRVMARMGISTLNSYQGAQLFDAVCLNREFVNEFFGKTPVIIEADGIHEIEESVLKRHAGGFDTAEPALDYGGELRHRKEGEWHAWSTACVISLNKFIRAPSDGTFREFVSAASLRPVSLKHLLHYRKGNSIPLDDVDPEENILKRFFSGAMSIGSLSPEAHETIAEACNRLGIRSNSGEGGEDPARYRGPKNSAIKQIASGRFGVTPTYLASAGELEIKIAQGAKPGEGGHLPSKKVTEYIAMLRYCSPNILLISPPPHHDIYSIEDLAQLINDLKEANPEAKVCVKLVAEAGVGTVAAGVAKAYADIIQISGGEGGTGASPFGSIRNAGNYWETGLAETQRMLIDNGLRGRVKLRVDGGLRTGKGVVIAALLGAEEFGFGTATMIAAGCIMARQCHLNTCPTGIATQDERLRGKFKGTAEGIMAYFRALARETRQILCDMGFRKLDDIIGRNDLLTVVTQDTHSGVKRMNFRPLIGKAPEERVRKWSGLRNDNPASSARLNQRLVEELLPYINNGEPAEREYRIRNVDRSVPVRLNYHIARVHGDEGLPPDSLQITFRGTAGQSFGAFNHKGMSLTLIGDANDYVGKGMYGGRIAIIPADISDPHRHVIVGNTVLYGATGGEFYAAGMAGERFGVRNSGAIAVIEGTGHHLCEYMTKGTVMVLGEAGFNIGAGMTGGVIYILDENDYVEGRLNTDYVIASALADEREILTVRNIMESHHRHTQSARAKDILTYLDKNLSSFKKVIPRSH